MSRISEIDRLMSEIDRLQGELYETKERLKGAWKIMGERSEQIKQLQTKLDAALAEAGRLEKIANEAIIVHRNNSALALEIDQLKASLSVATTALDIQVKAIKQLQAELKKHKDAMAKDFNEAAEKLLESIKAELDDYKEAYKDKQKLCREIDAIITDNNPAKQASLCDLVGPIRDIVAELDSCDVGDNEDGCSM